LNKDTSGSTVLRSDRATGEPLIARPTLLVSIHDVSPLTLDASRRIVDLVMANGVPLEALTVLVIPRHQGRAPLDEHSPTRDWLREMVEGGACLCLHGFTHIMAGTASNPLQWLWARIFARGQGELYLSNAADCQASLEAARAVIRRCELAEVVHGFVPPAWLLSPAAARVVSQSGFEFHEKLSGILAGDLVLARRLIGFGSLSSIESRLTSAHAWLQSHRRPADTRLAVHPADAQRTDTVEAIARTLRRLLPRLEPMNYMNFLRSQHAGTQPS
jgi:predicted deacetylase